MQSMQWYFRRLRAMSPGEIAWRLRSLARDVCDRPLRAPRVRWAGSYARASDANFNETVRIAPSDDGLVPDADPALLTRAGLIAGGRLQMFDTTAAVGPRPDWNRDYKHGVAAPLRHAPSIDYRDFRAVGDCKFVWEPSRHQHFVLLARAWRATGDARYLDAIAAHWESWLDQCPFGLGMQWRSPLELAVRIINWTWTWELTRAAPLPAELRTRVLASVLLHVWDIARKFSRDSSANNHLVGEAAGVFIAAAYFDRLHPRMPAWRAAARRILCQEIERQTGQDGVNREQAFGYHVFVTQLFTLAAIVGDRLGESFPDAYRNTLRAQHAFIAAQLEAGPAPMVGDADDGYVLDLGADPLDPREWLAVGATLFRDAELKAVAGAFSGTAQCLLGAEGGARFAAIEPLSARRPLRCRAFPSAGHYLLQAGAADHEDSVSVTFDCGPLGYGPLAAHGHADALSVSVRAFGVDVLVDPGTYDYFSRRVWRDYFRGTSAHNTVEVDGRDQSEMLGRFQWGARAAARVLQWRPTRPAPLVQGEHDGYRRLADPVIHRRTVELDPARRAARIVDELEARGAHTYAQWLHFSESCRVRALDGGFEIDTGRGLLTLSVDPRLEVTELRGSDDPIGGWVSRGYHRKRPSVSLVGRCAHSGPLRLETSMTIETSRPSVTPVSRRAGALALEAEGKGAGR